MSASPADTTWGCTRRADAPGLTAARARARPVRPARSRRNLAAGDSRGYPCSGLRTRGKEAGLTARRAPGAAGPLELDAAGGRMVVTRGPRRHPAAPAPLAAKRRNPSLLSSRQGRVSSAPPWPGAQTRASSQIRLQNRARPEASLRPGKSRPRCASLSRLRPARTPIYACVRGKSRAFVFGHAVHHRHGPYPGPASR